jgi:lipopolysaccharide export system permease protein
MKVTPDETGMIMTLYNGYSYKEIEERNVSISNKSLPFEKDYFKEQTIVVSLSGFDLERSSSDIFKFSSAVQNVSQLKQSIDSLSSLYLRQREIFFREFNTTRIYSERNFLQPGIPTADSVATSKLRVFDTRALFDSLPIAERKTVIAKAIENVRYGTNYLSEKEDIIHYETKTVRSYQVDLNKKITLSFACIIFFLIGAPLGAIIRKGGLGTPTVISILFFVFYYVISITAEKMVKEDLVNTFAGTWAASFILLPIGILLTYKATTDSSILNTETYFLFFKKIKDFVYRIVFNIKYENPSSVQ